MYSLVQANHVRRSRAVHAAAEHPGLQAGPKSVHSMQACWTAHPAPVHVVTSHAPSIRYLLHENIGPVSKFFLRFSITSNLAVHT